MLPTLLGRIQTRILLFLAVGVPVTAIYAYALDDFRFLLPRVEPFVILLALFLVGLALDPLYIRLQRLRWDRDWPFAFQLAAFVFEFLIVLGLVWLDVVPFVPSRVIATTDGLWTVLVHFLLVVSLSFVALLGIVQIFLVRWRYKGGEWGRL